MASTLPASSPAAALRIAAYEAVLDLNPKRAEALLALAVLRQGLRARMKASPLCDAPRFGRHLGTALRHAWHTACAGDHPA